MNVLVTGGAGYIGSHAVRTLLDAGHQVCVLDNLSTGNIWAIDKRALFIRENIGSVEAYRGRLREFSPETVIHFAAKTLVEESVSQAELYRDTNFVQASRMLEELLNMGVKRFLFSSTSAVYEEGSDCPVTESSRKAPCSPYGETKLEFEQYLEGVAKREDLEVVIFRYFNVAGAKLDGSLGQASPMSTHLIKIASEAAVGLRSEVAIFGTDYDTRDGTAERDYIHVEDVVSAHVAALTHDMVSGLEIYNLGYGYAFSVKEVLSAMQSVSVKPFEVVERGRRPGDYSRIFADNTEACRRLGWVPRFDSLETICETAMNWELQLRNLRGG